jgi:hypothetical protein
MAELQAFPLESFFDGFDEHGNPIFDRAITSLAFRKFWKRYFSNGVFFAPATNFQVMAAGSMNVDIAFGEAHVEGLTVFPDEAEQTQLALSPALTTGDRYDLIVLRADFSVGREAYVAIVEGKHDVADLTRNDIAWELALARVLVRQNATHINQQDITDLRLDTDFCGVVTEPITRTNTQEFFVQMQASLAEHEQWWDDFKEDIGDDLAELIKYASIDGNTNSIKVKRDVKANLPTLQEGELGYATDDKRLYIGSASGNAQVPKVDDPITIKGAVEGMSAYVGGGAREIEVKRKSSTVYSQAEDRANQWVRVARLQAPPADEPVSITFSVQANVRHDGVASNAQSFGGIITCKFTPNQTPKLYLIAGNYHQGLFILSYTNTDCDLWMLLRDNWESHTFSVINESDRRNSVNKWIMDTSRTSISEAQMSGLQHVRGQYIDDQPINFDLVPADWTANPNGDGSFVAKKFIAHMPQNAMGNVGLRGGTTKPTREAFRKAKIMVQPDNAANEVFLTADGDKPTITFPMEIRAKGVTP